MHRRQDADCEDGESEEGASFAPSFFGSLLGNIFGIFLLVLANVIFWSSIVVGGVIGYTLWGSFGAVTTAASAGLLTWLVMRAFTGAWLERY